MNIGNPVKKWQIEKPDDSPAITEPAPEPAQTPEPVPAEPEQVPA